MSATKDGWYVRICPTKTQVDKIHIWVGKGGDSSSHYLWRDWNRGDENEIDFPSTLRQVDEAWLRGEGEPSGKDVHMCLCFKDHVVQNLSFDDGEETEHHQGDSDDCDC